VRQWVAVVLWGWLVVVVVVVGWLVDHYKMAGSHGAALRHVILPMARDASVSRGSVTKK
jgi:hypothetical protein